MFSSDVQGHSGIHLPNCRRFVFAAKRYISYNKVFQEVNRKLHEEYD